VIDIDPNNEEANNGVRDLTGKQSQVAINAKEVRSLYYEGVDKFINGDIETAASLWKKVLAVDPGHVEAKKNLERANDMLKALQKRK
jgi:cytochrome c-type biogenesis protein CcmH/NrfG